MATPNASPLTFQRFPNLPRDCTFDPHDWNILAQYWHPVAFSSDLGDTPLAVTLLDEPLVMFRSNGQAVAARDICPHRGAPLSRGWVENGQIVCPYHGLTYGGDGKEHGGVSTDTAAVGRYHNASAGRQTEGSIDVAHFAWIHHGSFADRHNPVVPQYSVERRERGMLIVRERSCAAGYRFDP